MRAGLFLIILAAAAVALARASALCATMWWVVWFSHVAHATCFLTGTCGNGAVEAGEECDDANDNDVDGCRNSCVAGYPKVLVLVSTLSFNWNYLERNYMENAFEAFIPLSEVAS